VNVKLSVRETLGEISAEYRAHARQLVPLGFWFVLGPILAQELGGDGVGISLAIYVFQLTVATLFRGVVVELLRSEREEDAAPGSAELVWSVLPVALPLTVVGLLSAIGLVVGFVLLVVPGVILMTIWAVVAPAVVIERAGVIGSFKRSAALVRGNGVPVFAVVLVVTLLLTLSGVLFYGLITAAIAGTLVPAVLAALAASILFPLEGLAVAVLYYRLLEIERSAPAEPADPEAVPAS